MRFYIFLILKTQRYRLELSEANVSTFEQGKHDLTQGKRIKIQANYECRRHDTLHSPGCNEGKARNETLGIHRQSGLSSVGAALTASI